MINFKITRTKKQVQLIYRGSIQLKLTYTFHYENSTTTPQYTCVYLKNEMKARLYCEKSRVFFPITNEASY